MEQQQLEQIDKTILIIDDDVDFQLMMAMMLSERGFKVKSLFDGEFEAVTSHAKLCDLVLLDIDLPGFNGVDVGRHLKSDPETTSIPIILISGHTDAKQELTESHANFFMRKPFSLSAMLLKITQLLKVSSYINHH
jgi:DNA-binding response OmpR family regulator